MNQKNAMGFYDHLSFQGKCSILILYVFEKFQGFLLDFFMFSFFQGLFQDGNL